MRLNVRIQVGSVLQDATIEISCGTGEQHVRWLGLVASSRYQQECFPNAFLIPMRVAHRSEGVDRVLKPREVLHETLEDGDEVVVQLREGAQITDDAFYDGDFEWSEVAYGPGSNLRECRFDWTGKGSDFPDKVRGHYTVAREWKEIFSPKEIQEFEATFEVPVEPLEVLTQAGEVAYDWVAIKRFPPGVCEYVFVKEGTEMLGLTPKPVEARDGTQCHRLEFKWDCCIAPEPNADDDSRPSTASSLDADKVDPRFEQDWETMTLKWMEPHMKTRVKDVLIEFYAILTDLFDSYAFMGLDLTSAHHTIGMDDLKHLMVQCDLLNSESGVHIAWDQICTWFEEASGMSFGKPHLPQRLTRAHYLELLLRMAHFTMCHRPKPGQQVVALDEGFFRFITDVLIPVMDVYDDDPIRKTAVEYKNLIAIQQHRPSMRSIYSSLEQEWAEDQERMVAPAAMKHVLEVAQQACSEESAPPEKKAADKEAKEGEKPPEVEDPLAEFGEEGRLSFEQLEMMTQVFDEALATVTSKRPEPPETLGLYFWEFFEMVMHLARAPVGQEGLGEVHDIIPALVATMQTAVSLVEKGVIELPALYEDEEAEPEAPVA